MGDIRQNGNGSVTARIFDPPVPTPATSLVRTGDRRLRSEPPANSHLDSGRTGSRGRDRVSEVPSEVAGEAQEAPGGFPAGTEGARAAHEGILRRQSARESAARTYARALPIVPVRARGLTIEGADGRRYLDCLSGAGTLALGHNHPVVLEAIRTVLDSGAPLHVLDLATPVKDAFTTELFAHAAPGARRAGADPVLRTGRHRRGRGRLQTGPHRHRPQRPARLHRRLPRHDRGGARSAPGARTDARVARLPYPHDYRCPSASAASRGAELAARWTESAPRRPQVGGAAPRRDDPRTRAGRGRGDPRPGRLDAPDAGDHRGPLHPADRGRGADRRRPHRRLLGGRTQRRSCPT